MVEPIFDATEPRADLGQVTFDAVELQFNEWVIRAFVADGTVWYVRHGVFMAVPALRNEDYRLRPREQFILQSNKLGKGKHRAWSNDGDEYGDTHIVSEVGVLRMCFAASGLTAIQFADWILIDAGPLLRVMGLTEAHLDSLPVKRSRVEISKAPKTPAAVPQTLYRMFDANDRLLYIGISMTEMQRFAQHKSTKNWWNEITRIEFEKYPDRESVMIAEREAIKNESPRYNIKLAS